MDLRSMDMILMDISQIGFSAFLHNTTGLFQIVQDPPPTHPLHLHRGKEGILDLWI